MNPFTVGVCQLDSKDDREDNVERALELTDEAAGAGADLVRLPEVFTCIGPRETMREYAEPVPGPTTATHPRTPAPARATPEQQQPATPCTADSRPRRRARIAPGDTNSVPPESP